MRWTTLTLLAGLVGCTTPTSSTETTDADEPDAGLTWSNGISTLFQENCVRCHASGQFSTYTPFQTYDQVSVKFADISSKIQFPPAWGVQMPPFPGGELADTCEPEQAYSNDLRMSDDDIAAIRAWMLSGAPEGSGVAEPLVADSPSQLLDATEYSFSEGYVMSIGEDDDDGHKDDYVCVIVDPGLLAPVGYLSGIQINPGVNQVFRGAVVWLDPNRDSRAYVEAGSTRAHGENWYDCDEGFGFEGQILAGFLPKGEPIATPPGAAIEIDANALIVYKIHYHAHYDHVNPDDTDKLPPLLEWADDTSLSLRWEKPGEVARVATALTFGNYDESAVDGTGTLTAPFLIPPGAAMHVESMVRRVPGDPDDGFAVWAVLPEMKDAGRTVAVSVTRQDSSRECLAANPRWEASWQLPLTYDTTIGAPMVYGGDQLRIDCTYLNPTGLDLTLAEESCRAMIGLVPVD